MEKESTDHPECRKILALLSEYLDEELPADLADCVSAHIADCGPCVEFLASLRQSVALCKQYTPQTMPSPLNKEVSEELRRAYQRMILQRNASGPDTSSGPQD